MFLNALKYDEKDISNCGFLGFVNRDRKRVTGESIIKGIAAQRERGNGLGGGFAVYGLYPDYPHLYAFHCMFQFEEAKKKSEEFLQAYFNIENSGEIPTRSTPQIQNSPLHWRYFLAPYREKIKKTETEQDYIVDKVMQLNKHIDGAYITSSGKNMGAFKGVGYPEEIGEFFRLEEYSAYAWVAHNRFPTNTPGWWGGAHPFVLLDFSIVHNGELSSYGINKRYLEEKGYECTMQTDTEAVAYLLDLLIRRHQLSVEMVLEIFSPPYWKDIDKMDPNKKTHYTNLRKIYGGAMLNGPFSFIIGYERGLIGLADRLKLRPLVVGKKDATMFFSSEDSTISLLCPDAEKIWRPRAGEPVYGFYYQ